MGSVLCCIGMWDWIGVRLGNSIAWSFGDYDETLS